MAYNNKYQKYLNDDSQSEGSISSFINRASKIGAKIVGAAALLGGGYSGLRYLNRSGALSGLKTRMQDALGSTGVTPALNNIRTTFDIAEGIATGAEKTIKRSGMLRVFSGQAHDELSNNLSQGLRSSIIGRQRGVSGTPTAFESQAFGFSQTLSAHARETVYNVRVDNILQEVKSRFSKDEKVSAVLENIIKQEKRNTEMVSGLQGVRNKHEFITKVLRDHEAHLKLDSIGYVKAESFLEETLAYHNIKNKNYIKENRNIIKQRMDSINKQYHESIVEINKSPTLGQSFMNFLGYDRLTVGRATKEGVLSSSMKQDHFLAMSKDGSNRVVYRNPDAIAKKMESVILGLSDTYVDPLVFVNRKTNEVVDLRFGERVVRNVVHSLSQSLQIPFINIKPFKMLDALFSGHQLNVPNSAAILSGTKRSPTIMPTITGNLDPMLDDYFYFNKRVVDHTGKLVKANTYLREAQYGAAQRTVGVMAGHTNNPRIYGESTNIFETMNEWLGIGHQDFESVFARKATLVTKFFDKEWDRNIWDNLTTPGGYHSVDPLYVNEAFSRLFKTVTDNTKALDRDTLESLIPHLEGTLSPGALKELVSGPQKESVMAAIHELLNKADTPLAYQSQLKKIMNKFKKDKDFLDRPVRTFKYSYEWVTPGVVDTVVPNTTELLTGIDEAEKLLHAELLNQIERLGASKSVTVGAIVSDLISQKNLSKAQANSILNLDVHKSMQRIAGSNYFPGISLSREQSSIFSNFMEYGVDDPTRNQLQSIIQNANPLLGFGPGQVYEPAIKGSQFLVMNEWKKPWDIKEYLTQFNRVTAEGGTMFEGMRAVKDTLFDRLFYQHGFGSYARRYGRGNSTEINTGTHLSFYYGFRLNEGISSVGLGLRPDDMGSAQDVWKNLFLKRIMAPIGILGGLNYLNDELGNITGEKPTQSLARAYANTTVGVQAVKEITGLNALGEEIGRLLPGSERLWENPIGMAIRFGTFGVFGETRSAKEMNEYYERGVDPLRKGRFWSIGSSTPWYGDKIKFYQPNWYRRKMADYMMTDVMYGSTTEYWENSALPNPRNVLGFLNPFTWRHWEKKHWDSRPYPLSSTGLEQIPIVGPVLDATIGRIFMPFRRRAGLEKAHREYLEKINRLTEQYSQQERESGFIQITPSGRMSNVRVDPQGHFAGSDGEGVPVSYVSTETGEVQPIDPRSGFSPMQSGHVINKEQLSVINRRTIQRSHIRPVRTNNIQSLRDNLVVDSLDRVGDPNSIGHRLGEAYYSMTEIGGIYGFIATSLTGDLGDRKAILQSSSRMTGFERKFWDMELGGFGGDLSEIYRRFIPRRRRQIKEYNPFRNTMPDWMPGPEYFTDFKHGDPYVKIQKGEMRLPGAGYESLNRLNPDPFFGRYGAVDRFKILADVAPWSDQYRYYSTVVSRMHDAQLISEENFSQVQEVKKQVRNVKKKHDFYPYRFKHADVTKEEVTIVSIIDNNTFLTKEHPGNPIRLAGIKMPAMSDKSSEAEQARAHLAQYVKVGNKIRIGLDADPLHRVRDDTMGTMHAVVYDGYGDPVQAKMARKFKKSVKADFEDNSAVAVNALFDSSQITVGSLWERFAHMHTPFHTKLLQIRSPLEMYKRKEIYGKSWQTWRNPIRDWVIPTHEAIIRQSPIASTLIGATVGSMFGVFLGSKKMFALAGAVIAGVGSSIRTIGEFTKRTVSDSSYTWIPKRRRVEREIEEYFDVLKYVKYRGLYEKTRKLAIEKEGIDPEQIIRLSDKKSSSTSYKRGRLDAAKKWLNINKAHPFSDKDRMESRIKGVNQVLNEIEMENMLLVAGPYTMRALQYKQESKATLYGADPHGDLATIYRSLPKKDKPFFREFMLAPPKEREEILRLVPRNQRRFYQAKWGLEVDERPSLEEFFQKHHLPDANWQGWKPEYSIEKTKLKFVKNEGLEIGEFGFWEDDLQHVGNAPDITNHTDSGISGLFINSGSLTKVLEGAGLRDVDIKVVVEDGLENKPTNPFNVSATINHNRRQDINDIINNNISELVS